MDIKVKEEEVLGLTYKDQFNLFIKKKNSIIMKNN